MGFKWTGIVIRQGNNKQTTSKPKLEKTITGPMQKIKTTFYAAKTLFCVYLYQE